MKSSNGPIGILYSNFHAGGKLIRRYIIKNVKNIKNVYTNMRILFKRQTLDWYFEFQ